MKIPYRKIRRNGRAFFELGRERAIEAGWYRPDGSPRASIPLGNAGESADAEALRLYHKYLADSGRMEPRASKPSEWPAGSLGAFFGYYRQSEAWGWKKPRTREDYERCWPRISKEFGRKVASRIGVADSERFHMALHTEEKAGKISANERYRTLKVWRALLRLLETHAIIAKAPIGSIPNPQVRGRKQSWFAPEIETLRTKAQDMGYAGMSLAIWIAWETLLSPVDVRTLSLAKRHKDAQGAYFHLERGKTGKEVFAAISDELNEAIDAYVDALPVTLTPDAPLIRQRNGNAYRSKDTFGDDFRAVRGKAFKGDKRQFMDIRRSGNLEADLGGADAESRGAILANGLAGDKFLDETYTPPTVAKAREVAKQRIEGRAILSAYAGPKCEQRRSG